MGKTTSVVKMLKSGVGTCGEHSPAFGVCLVQRKARDTEVQIN